MQFFEVFENLIVEQALVEMFEEVVVLRVAASRTTNRILVYISSKRLISRKNIKKMEA